jgi:hypothetical protein
LRAEAVSGRSTRYLLVASLLAIAASAVSTAGDLVSLRRR